MTDKIYPLTVPKWGIEMQEGTVTEWHSEVGDELVKGQDLIDIETDKIVNTLEVPVDGTLRRRLVESGETLKVGELLGIIASPEHGDDEIEKFISDFVPADASFGVGEELESAETEPKSSETSSGDHQADSVNQGPPRISPVARRLAEQLGVDLGKVKGSGRNGRISTEDVQAAAAGKSPSSQAGTGAADPVPLNARALAQARRMTESKQTVPHFYLSRDIDMTAAVALQKSSGLPLTAIIVRALVKALQAEPAVNMHFQKDALQKPAEIGINIAIDTEEGLVAPLLGNLEKLSLDETAANLKSLAQRARDRKLEKPDLQAGSMTLSNLGMFGIHSFSAIINPPQVAILAVGSIRPLQLEMEAGAVPAMTATLSCDHRAIDGATGARFLQAVQVAIAEL